MAWKPTALVAAALLVTACSKSDEDYIADACIEGGNDRSTCECTAKILAESLSLRQLEMLAGMRRLQAEEGLTEEEAQTKMMEEYNMMDLLGLGMASIEPAARAEQECS